MESQLRMFSLEARWPLSLNGFKRAVVILNFGNSWQKNGNEMVELLVMC